MPREENVIVRQAWKLEKDLFYSLVSKSLKILPASRRAAVSIVLRFGSLSRDIPVDSTRSLLDFLQYIEVSGASNLQILYIQRAKQANDPWSGHIAFPGGRQEGNEKDIETAIRETKEEVGLDLGNWRHFICIGRLSDREIRLRNRSLNDSAYCAFVFLQLTAATPPLKLCPSEVASAFWVSLDTFLLYGDQLLCTKAIERKWDIWWFRWLSYLLPKSIYHWLALDRVYFSAIALKPWVVAMEYAKDGVIAAGRDDPLWLWGLTLAATSDLLESVMDKRLDHIFVTPANRLVSWWIPSKC
ncbi:hypothetical protein GAYE_SCF26G4591 [Galdieria yellowstonensis]|uniref:Nudix hydrolase domain-containing protein n=1 Tax=Galdieria yellowstonensis TaxID=3028027 RepID=A0AAV9IGS8_9RHOD|nr:hypothetical protein GAYE_SCF26G4591 [Galdieria yellowstonensis]